MSQLRILTEHEVNHNRNKYTDMVGKQVTLMSFGQPVKGIVKRVFEDEYSFRVEIHHEPVNYNGDIYTKGEFFARKFDDWGPLNTVKVI